MEYNNICITGSSGFIGKNLITYLKKRKVNIYELSLNPDNTNYFDISKLKNRNNLKKIFIKKKINCLINLSWSGIHTPYDIMCYKKNLKNLKILLNISLKAKIKKFISIGSIDEYKKSNEIFENSKTDKNTQNYYSKGKQESLQLVKKFYEKNFVHLRIPNVYGFKKNKNFLINKIFNLNKLNKIITLNNLNQQKVYIFIDDLTKAIFKVMHQNLEGVINIGHGKSISAYQFARVYYKILNPDKKLQILNLKKNKKFLFSSKILKEKNYKHNLKDNLKKIIKLQIRYYSNY